MLLIYEGILTVPQILLTVGRAHLRIAGGVDAAALAQVLARLLP